MKNIILTIFAIIGFATVVTGFTNIVVNDSHQELVDIKLQQLVLKV